ncbi:hypothetical protein CCACVL1_03600 [Corchorus capsularis]|uniref:Uncharacterized protein n=1 Tax=Corchorus capsularis TaxID=210143 RepID=A0A1R3JYE6_COCAP|nr:hypothetical protein CCACVL1_03600 [Corchorus capsularis]
MAIIALRYVFFFLLLDVPLTDDIGAFCLIGFGHFSSGFQMNSSREALFLNFEGNLVLLAVAISTTGFTLFASRFCSRNVEHSVVVIVFFRGFYL